MCTPAKIKKLDTVVVNRIAAGEVIQRPANALKELIENSLDAKSNSIQITVKEGGLKLLQIQDNGTGIRKDDMDIVCERFTTSKLQNFEDLRSIATFGFRGEALASISHVALLTITTKTVDEKCAYKASYIDGKLKAPPKPCAGNQGTTILIENLFYNVTTRRKALKNTPEEFSKIVDVVTRYAIHNPMVGFTLKKHGEINTHVRTAHNSTKVNNVRALFSNAVARELLEIEHKDDTYKFNLQALITNPNYSSKRMTFMLFINNRLVDSSPIRKMLEDLYSIYLPKKTYPWCYVSLEINPNNVDVNVHPTKHEVRFLHEDAIIEKVKIALDEKLSSNNASRTFYIQARLPKVDITKDTLKEVLPEYDKNDTDKSKKIHPREMIRTDSSDQKLDKFNFTLQAKDASNKNLELVPVESMNFEDSETSTMNREVQILDGKVQTTQHSDNILSSNESFGHFSENIDALQLAQSEFVTSTQVEKDKDTLDTPNLNQDILEFTYGELETSASESVEDSCSDGIANQALKRVYQYLGNRGNMDYAKTMVDKDGSQINNKENNSATGDCSQNEPKEEAESSFRKEEQSFPMQDNVKETKSAPVEFKSHSVNNFKREVKLTSVLKLRKQVEDDYHEGLREILSNMIFVGCVDETFALIQSGVNLYICNTQALTEELFYEIMLYDFANYGVIRFSEPIPLYDLAMLGLDSEEAGWSMEDGSKEDLANNVKELLLEKADMMKEYFSIVIDKRGNLKSLPILVDKYFPCEAGLPLYILRLATEVNWKEEQPCFRDVCRETAKFFSQVNSNDGKHGWKHVTEHILYPTIKSSLLPPKQFAHDSTILQIASLPDLYKIFERC